MELLKPWNKIKKIKKVLYLIYSFWDFTKDILEINLSKKVTIKSEIKDPISDPNHTSIKKCWVRYILENPTKKAVIIKRKAHKFDFK